MKQLSNINRFSETKEVARINARKELDEFIPLIPAKITNVRPHWLSAELKRLKKSWKFDMAAKMGEVMFKGAFPAIEARYKKEYQQVIKLA
jgi:hypothetical protein